MRASWSVYEPFSRFRTYKKMKAILKTYWQMQKAKSMNDFVIISMHLAIIFILPGSFKRF